MSETRAVPGPQPENRTVDRPPATEALPVRLDLRGAHAASIRRWIESVVGWQPVEGARGALDPVVVLADVAAAGGDTPGDDAPGDDAPRDDAVHDRPDASDKPVATRDEDAALATLPRVVLVAEDDDAVRAGVAGRDAAAVLAWPEERERLPATVAHLTPQSRTGTGCVTLTVGGAAGGVGTTTVAFALAGLAAWRHSRALVTTPAAPGAPPRARAVLEGAPAWAAGESVTGVAGLRCVELPPGELDADLDPGGAGFVVRDRGQDLDVDVLVARRDRRSLTRMGGTTAGIVLVTAEGPAASRALRGAAGGRRVVLLPWSARVARASLTGRVPAGLPGAWLRRLVPVLEAWR